MNINWVGNLVGFEEAFFVALPILEVVFTNPPCHPRHLLLLLLSSSAVSVHKRRPSPANMETRKEETGREKEGKREEKGIFESQMEEGRDIVSQLFNYDLYEALQIVFLRSLSTAALNTFFFRYILSISQPLYQSLTALTRSP